MKTIEQIEAETGGNVYTLEDFIKLNQSGFIIPYDGIGYFHDGENRTKKSVWDNTLKWEDVKDYPYVCWYNK